MINSYHTTVEHRLPRTEGIGGGGSGQAWACECVVVYAKVIPGLGPALGDTEAKRSGTGVYGPMPL